MNCGVGRRCGSDPELLWLWCRPAAIALIRPLAWEIPRAKGLALKSKKKTKNKKPMGYHFIPNNMMIMMMMMMIMKNRRC